MSGTIAGTELTVRTTTRASEGLVLVGKARYRSLGIGLHLAGGSDWLRARDHRASTAWDGHQVVACRETAQARAVLGVLAPTLVSLGDVDMDDTELNVSMEHDTAAYVELGERLIRFAEALPEARAEIPPPASLTHQLDTWRELAEELGGVLEVGDISIRCNIEGIPCQIRNLWHPPAPGQTLPPEPHGVRLTVRSRAAAELLPERQVWRLLDEDLVDGAVLDQLSRDDGEAVLYRDRVELVLPALVAEPAALAEQLRLLHRIATMLTLPQTPSHGPYR
jgi:hypothetical protein